jgi:hypothetical protein
MRTRLQVKKIERLTEALNNPDHHIEATEAIWTSRRLRRARPEPRSTLGVTLELRAEWA